MEWDGFSSISKKKFINEHNNNIEIDLATKDLPLRGLRLFRIVIMGSLSMSEWIMTQKEISELTDILSGDYINPFQIDKENENITSIQKEYDGDEDDEGFRRYMKHSFFNEYLEMVTFSIYQNEKVSPVLIRLSKEDAHNLHENIITGLEMIKLVSIVMENKNIIHVNMK